MTDRITSRAQHVLELLAEESPAPNDFVGIAVAGERLRRDASLEEATPLTAAKALRGYDAVLQSWRKLAPTELDEALIEALDALGQAASAPIGERDPEMLEDSLWDVDAVLCVAAASVRAGRMTADQLGALAARAADWASEAATEHPVLWALADELEVQLGPDADHPGLYRWTAPLTRYAESSGALRGVTGLRDPRVRQAIIDRALVRLNPPVAGELVEVEFTKPPALALAAASAVSEDPAIEGQVVYDEDGVQIRVSEQEAAGGSFAVVRVRLAPRVDADLSSPEAVLIEDIDGRKLGGDSGLSEPRLWWRQFSATGLVRIWVRALNLRVDVTIRRPKQ